MNRADLGGFQTTQMAGPAIRFLFSWRGSDGLAHSLANAPAHLPGGSIGESDCDELVDLGPVIAQVGQIALGQDMRLATTRAGGKHHGRLPANDRGLLLRRQTGLRAFQTWRRLAHRFFPESAIIIVAIAKRNGNLVAHALIALDRRRRLGYHAAETGR